MNETNGEAVKKELRAQRNTALDLLANANGRIADLEFALSQANAEIERLKKEIVDKP